MCMLYYKTTNKRPVKEVVVDHRIGGKKFKAQIGRSLRDTELLPELVPYTAHQAPDAAAS